MTKKPILFSAPMVRAILAGHKTQTRRVVKCAVIQKGERIITDLPCPYGDVGTRLWVRETWFAGGTGSLKDGRGIEVEYRADDTEGWQGIWRPAIFMPRWASRITLEITDVRVERLQDISEADALTEGLPLIEFFKPTEIAAFTEWECRHPHAHSFSRLWDSINAPRGYGWDKNPWVWVISFKRR
jgi:hypothetical protein